MIAVSGHMTNKAGKRLAFLTASKEAMKSGRAVLGCRDVVVSADPFEDVRVNVSEERDPAKAMLAFFGDCSDSAMTEIIVNASVRRHSVANAIQPGLEGQECSKQQ